MLNKLIAWIAGSKIGKLLGGTQGFLKGKKSNLLGLITCLQGLAGLVDQIIALDGSAALIEMMRSLPDNPDWKMLLAGIGILTFRAAIKKDGLGGAQK